MIQASAVYCLNETGGRAHNEDAVWPAKGSATTADRLFMVCDGVGGSNAGEIASALTCESFATYFQKNLQPNIKPDASFINQAQQYTLAQFKDLIEKDPALGDMSTTLTFVYIAQQSVLAAWCGDSRIYHIRNGEICFQSRDHSLVNQLIKAGEITEAEAQQHPQKNMILRAIQYKEKPSVIECVELTDVRPGDHLLLCSDGLLENINPQILHDLLEEGEEKDYARAIDAICNGKTRDNYSMYLLKLTNS